MSDVVRLKESTKKDLIELREKLSKNFMFSVSPDISDSALIDLCVHCYLDAYIRNGFENYKNS